MLKRALWFTWVMPECQVDDVDAVVISSAIHQNNPELMEAKKRNLPILHRSDVLAEILNHADGVAVAGAHGKTTTSAMISCIAAASDIDPTIIIGGEVGSWRSRRKGQDHMW